MPSSHLYQLNEIMSLIYFTKPQNILDIGVGFGKYGVLCREYLELWDGRQEYTKWERRIDGIEAFEKYITPLHKFIYDNIYIGNAIDILPTLEISYDVILLVDVLEHFEYEQGLQLLSECKNKGKNIIISTPRNIGSQKDAFGNVYETHKFQWTKKHFEKIKPIFFIPNTYSLICYIGKDAPQVWNAFISRVSRFCF